MKKLPPHTKAGHSTAHPTPMTRDVRAAGRIIANSQRDNSIQCAILLNLERAGRSGLEIIALAERVIPVRGIKPTLVEMVRAIDYLLEKGCVLHAGPDRYRLAVTLRETQAICRAYELAAASAARTGTFDWPRCKRNARAQLRRAGKIA
jgi:hypothetical protein